MTIDGAGRGGTYLTVVSINAAVEPSAAWVHARFESVAGAEKMLYCDSPWHPDDAGGGLAAAAPTLMVVNPSVWKRTNFVATGLRASHGARAAGRSGYVEVGTPTPE